MLTPGHVNDVIYNACLKNVGDDKVITHYLKPELTDDNVATIWKFAKDCRLTSLENACREFEEKNRKILKQNERFKRQLITVQVQQN